MPYTIEIRPLATMEILEAHDWYEAQQEGLGLNFIETLDGFFNMLLRNPLVCSFLQDNIRQGSIKPFPYVVVYEVFEEKIVVFSVFHAKQDPAKKRMG